MTKTIRCFKCDGKGKIKDGIDWLPAVFTFGMTALIDASSYHRCDACNGKGYLKVEDN